MPLSESTSRVFSTFSQGSHGLAVSKHIATNPNQALGPGTTGHQERRTGLFQRNLNLARRQGRQKGGGTRGGQKKSTMVQ